MTVELFHLAAMARCVTMATTETPKRKTMQEAILQVLSSYLNDSLLHRDGLNDGKLYV